MGGRGVDYKGIRGYTSAFPVISFGMGIPIIFNKVGATSASIPSFIFL
jgi:hypothetical protein